MDYDRKNRYKFTVKPCLGKVIYFELQDGKHNKALVCFILGIIYEFKPKYMDMVYIATAKKYQGKGHAADLLERTQAGMDEIRTQWDESTESGRAICLKCGFKREKEKSPTGEMLDLLIWRKDGKGQS